MTAALVKIYGDVIVRALIGFVMFDRNDLQTSTRIKMSSLIWPAASSQFITPLRVTNKLT